MFSSIEFVREICRQRKIPVSTLERDCGFSNGYLNPRKLTQLPYSRAVTIAEYLNLPVEQILTGKEKNASAPEDKRAVTDADIKFALFGGDGEITDEMYEEVKQFAAYLKHKNR